MRPSYSVAQIRAAEQAVMARVPPGALMTRAAHAAAVQAVAMIGFSYGARISLLVGAGDNGGDALYAGAYLARRGAQVKAVLAAPDKAHADGLQVLREAGGRVVPLSEAAATVDLIVDGLVGIGARGALRDSLVPLAELAQSSAAPVLAVDLPSGIDPETGAVEGTAVTATVTVCFGALKSGLLVGEGRVRSGEIRLVDIGITGELDAATVYEWEDSDVARALVRPGPGDDKYSRGVVGVAAGSEQYPGAAQLAVGAARLGGVGAVRYAGFAYREVSRAHPDVLVSDTVTLAGRVQAWTVGPGLGRDDHARHSLAAVLDQDVPVLIDADGLNLLDGDPAPVRARTAPTVLTPHDREFERLFGAIGSDRIAAARRAASAAGAVVLLKGFVTIVATPDGTAYVNPTGTPALATAGSGDVLSGLIGSLLATGVDPATAAITGAYLHGQAGRAAAVQGPVTSMDLVPALSHLLATYSVPAR